MWCLCMQWFVSAMFVLYLESASVKLLNHHVYMNIHYIFSIRETLNMTEWLLVASVSAVMLSLPELASLYYHFC